jgi:hypothetical protein
MVLRSTMNWPRRDPGAGGTAVEFAALWEAAIIRVWKTASKPGGRQPVRGELPNPRLLSFFS